MAIYLMAASSMTKYHAYVSAAVSAALRMGLHEQIPGFSDEEQTKRQKLWLSVHAMDVYASSALGLLSSFAPIELCSQPMPLNSTAMELSAEELATAAHRQLAGILHSCLDRVYHRGGPQTAAGQAQTVTSRSLREASEELNAWELNYSFLAEQVGGLAFPGNKGRADPTPLPQLSPCTKTQLLLFYAYYQAWLLLYTPFIHHLVKANPNPASEGYLYGTKCMRAAIAVIHIGEELKRRFQLNEAYLYTVDILVNSHMVLLAIELGSADAKLLRAAIPAGRRAKILLLALTPLSLKALECWEALAVCFTLFCVVSRMMIKLTDAFISQPLHENGSGRELTFKPRDQVFDSTDVLDDLSPLKVQQLDGDIIGVNPVHIWSE